MRAIKNAKTCFLAGVLLDKLVDKGTSWKKPTGATFELVADSHSVLFTGSGMPIEVKLLWKGEGLANRVVSFISQCGILKPDFDEVYERRTDESGVVKLTPKSGNRYLIVSHLRREDEKAEGFEVAPYSATLQLLTPEVCPCCE